MRDSVIARASNSASCAVESINQVYHGEDPGGSQRRFNNDQTQGEFGNYLQQVTGGNKDVPLVFYCQSVECWMSYNAALRAAKLGYTQVLWYRGGIEAWQTAGLQTQSRQR